MQLETTKQELLLELATIERTLDAELTAARPDKVELNKLYEDREALRNTAARAKLNVADVELDIRRIQEEMSKWNRRYSADKAALGAVTDVEKRRDYEHDLASTSRRVSDLQQELKEAHDDVNALRANADRQGAQLDELERVIAMKEREVEAASLPDGADERAAELRVLLPADVLKEYDDQRSIFGVGAANFSGRSCGGCHIVLPPAAISEIRNAPVETVPRCPDCGTFLIR